MTAHHIFISYSHDNMIHMQRVKQTLQAAGLIVWTDENLQIGTPNWQIAIEDAIEKSACVVCILTPQAKHSKWVREELVYSTLREKRVYMVHIDGQKKDVAMLGFVVAQTVDVRDTNLYDPRMTQLCNRIQTTDLPGKLDTQQARQAEARTQPLPDPEAIMNYRAGANNEDDANRDKLDNRSGEETSEFVLSSIPTNEKHMLIVQQGKEYTPTTIFEINQTFVTIGRDETSTIFINDTSVSRDHLQLIYTSAGFLARDLGSTNGTYINAERIRQMRTIKHDDRIQVGPNVALVYKKSQA